MTNINYFSFFKDVTINETNIKDIFKRISFNKEYKNDKTLFGTHKISDGETPESLARYYYDFSDLYWIILISNDMYDYFYDWPLTESEIRDLAEKEVVEESNILDLTPGTDYVNGDDVNFNFPAGQTGSGVVPAKAAFGTLLYFGDHAWSAGYTAGNNNITYSNGSTYGQLRFGPTGSPWDTFQSSDKNGMQTITFDNNSGSFQYYYDNQAFINAFDGTFNSIVIDTNGSVYKDSISESNLVVTGTGEYGQAAGSLYKGVVETQDEIYVRLSEQNDERRTINYLKPNRIKDFLFELDKLRDV